MEFDKDGLLLPRTSTPEKIAAKLAKKKLSALEYLVSEFRAGRLNTRSPEFKKRNQDYQSLVDRLNGVSTPAPPQPASPTPHAQPTPPGPSRGGPAGGPGSANTGDSGVGSTLPGSPGGTRSRGPNHPDTKDMLDLSGLDYESAPLNLKLRYFELRKISLSNLPIAAAILTRSVLEATIKVHFEGSPTPATGQLSDVFKRVVQAYGQEKSLKSSISLDLSRLAHGVVVAGCFRRVSLIVAGGCDSSPEALRWAGIPGFPWVFQLVGSEPLLAGGSGAVDDGEGGQGGGQ